MDFSFFQSANVVNNAAAVPIVVALVQLFKLLDPSGKKIAKFAPFIALGVGVLIAFLTVGNEMPMHEKLLAGVLYGLSASGLYSSTKATAHTIKKEQPQPQQEPQPPQY